MSYINDALRKVQKEKKSYNISYSHIISTPEKKFDRSQKLLLLAGLLLVFFSTAGVIVLLYWPEDKKAPVLPQEIASVRVQEQVSVAPAQLQAIKEAITVPQNKPEIKKGTKSVELKDKPTITDSKALYAQALRKQYEGKLEKAKDLYVEVLKSDQMNVQALNNLGVIYMNQKNYKKAIKCFNNALAIKHNYVDAHYNLACLYAQKRDTEQSLFYLKNAIEFNPQAKQWAKSDADLKVLSALPEFINLMEKPGN